LSELGDLFPDVALDAAARALPVVGLTADSRKVEPGFVFFAVPGTKADGSAFVPQALAQGAVAIVGSHVVPRGATPFVQVEDVRAALSQAAARLYPRQPNLVVAVTGTSGKTSVAAFTRQIWAALGQNAAALGTIGITTSAGTDYGSLTTPDPVTLHRTLDRLAGEGISHLAMEASSHGLEQRRLDGVRLAAGAFTNLSRDHLDYHSTLESYLEAKLRLFDTLLPVGASAVIDADSTVAGQVIAACDARGLKSFTVGLAGRTLRLVRSEPRALTTHLVLEYEGQVHSVVLPLAGAFQVSNALVAAGLCIATGSPAADVIAALGMLTGAPGRLELAGSRGGASVFVDYAHKPDALEKALATVRPLARGKLAVVFGCGGDRDVGKRPIMGEIAARLADRVFVTDDNPRSEKAAAIRAAIRAGMPADAAGIVEIADRAQAIRTAIAELRDGDVLLIAGKGHETGQIIGDTVLPFSDLDCARAALKDAVDG
jgi:UDP-N-acetylmuramoyl-L-alanyl-D-glutamate--2,6-diaminopimelate ligase